MGSVSVIVPVYNVEAYLEECLDSILGQTWKDLEVICVNDGSTDRGAEILSRYEATDSRVKVITTPNQGLSLARNTGLQAATGKYIYFVDSDDFIIPDAIEQMYNRSEQDELDLLAVGMLAFALQPQFEERVAHYNQSYHIDGEYPDVYSGMDLLCKMKTGRDYRVNAYSTFVQRSLLQENAILFYPKILHEDNLYTFQIYSCAQRAGVLKSDVYCRRFREGSIVSQDGRFENFYGCLVSLQQIENTIDEKKLYDENFEFSKISFNQMRNSSVSHYLALPEDEQNKIASLSAKESFCFYAALEPEIQRRREIVHSREQKQNNSELAAANQELAEKNKKLRERQKRLTADMKKQKKEYTQKMNELYHSKSYRLGNAILYLPKKLKHLIERYKKEKYYCPCCNSPVEEFQEFEYYKRKDRYNEALYHGYSKHTLCPVCKSLPRHRIICAYFDQHRELFENKKVLAFAIEKGIKLWMDREKITYTTADYFKKADLKLDVQNMELPDQCFDVVICNHVLEHVEDDFKALREINRILCPGGTLIVSVPMLKEYEHTVQDPTIVDEQERKLHFGQVDHLRVFGRDFEQELKNAGFSVTVIDGNRFSRKIRPVIGPASYDSNQVFCCTKPMSAE